jgi:hypothetical protein
MHGLTSFALIENYKGRCPCSLMYAGISEKLSSGHFVYGCFGNVKHNIIKLDVTCFENHGMFTVSSSEPLCRLFIRQRAQC